MVDHKPFLDKGRSIIINLFNRGLQCFCFVFVWCPCMAIDTVRVQYNGEFLPDIILLTPCYYHRETRLNDMKRFCICSLLSHQNVLIFSP